MAGVATFAGCKVDKAGTYSLTATASGLSGGAGALQHHGRRPEQARLHHPAQHADNEPGCLWHPAGRHDPGRRRQHGHDRHDLGHPGAHEPWRSHLRLHEQPEGRRLRGRDLCRVLVDKAGTYTLTAADGSLTSATSTGFTITSGAATKPVFLHGDRHAQLPDGCAHRGHGRLPHHLRGQDGRRRQPRLVRVGRLTSASPRMPVAGETAPRPPLCPSAWTPSVTSGSTLLKLPPGNPSDTTYRATAPGLTAATCQLRKN